MHNICLFINAIDNHNYKRNVSINYACRADKDSYRHDRRADKNPYRHDRADSQCRKNIQKEEGGPD